jgi:lysophospholipase L1-like esterase
MSFVRFLKDALVSAAVAVVLFGVFELALRLAAPQLPRTEALDGASRALPDSVLGHRYRPHSRAIHRTPEFTVEYAIDARGRRARRAPEPADSSAVRIVVLGDSFTFGDGNAEEDVWVRVMERALRERGQAVDVVNAGVEGYDTRSELLYLREIAPEIRPDVVVLGFLANDVYTNAPLEAPAPKSAGEHRGGGFALHAVEWAKRTAMRSDRVYAQLFLLSSRREFYAASPRERAARQIELTRELVGSMESWCRESGAAFVVVSIPQQFAAVAQARGYRFPGVDPTVIDARLAGLARERGFPWIEALPALADAYREDEIDLFHRVDGHLTPAGNRVVGELAAGALAPIVAARAASRASR